MPSFARSAGSVIAVFAAVGTTTTSVFERTFRRSPASTRPACSTWSIWATSAEKKASAGAPALICRARSLEAPKLNVTRSPVRVAKEPPSSFSTSVRLAAAKTRTSSARAGTAASSAARQRARMRERDVTERRPSRPATEAVKRSQRRPGRAPVERRVLDAATRTRRSCGPRPTPRRRQRLAQLLQWQARWGRRRNAARPEEDVGCRRCTSCCRRPPTRGPRTFT